MNWKAKIGVQSVLAHIPGGESLNHRLQWMNRRYAPGHLKRRTVEQAKKLAKLAPYVKGGMVMEVGTGWELIAPILFNLMGAKWIYTYDHVAHLREDIPRIVLEQIDPEEIGSIIGVSPAQISKKLAHLKSAARDGVLRPFAGIFYRAPGDACNSGLAPQSVDLFFTYETLEHVPEHVLEGLVLESKRVLKSSGVAYHAIEPGDHYTREESHINHFKYPEWLWSPLVKNKISYHNRLTERQFLESFKRHGAEIVYHQSLSSERDIADLQNGFRRDARFASFTPRELAVWYSEIMYRFPTESQS